MNPSSEIFICIRVLCVIGRIGRLCRQVWTHQITATLCFIGRIALRLTHLTDLR